MLRKNTSFWVKYTLFMFKRVAKQKSFQIVFFAAFLSFGLNGYQLDKNDYVLYRSLPNFEIAQKVKKLSSKHKISSLLVTSVILSESTGYPFAVSHMNAKGLMQLMPATAEYIAKRLDKNLYKKLKKTPGAIYEPENNINLAILHLKSMYVVYSDKKWDSALHVYNLGGRAFKRGRRNYPYVKKILKRLALWRS